MEVYVRPQFRRQGYGTRLLQSLKELSNKTGLSLQILIPFVDSQPSNPRIVEKILSKEGYHLPKWVAMVFNRGQLRASKLLRRTFDKATVATASNFTKLKTQ